MTRYERLMAKAKLCRKAAAQSKMPSMWLRHAITLEDKARELTIEEAEIGLQRPEATS